MCVCVCVRMLEEEDVWLTIGQETDPRDNPSREFKFGEGVVSNEGKRNLDLFI